jgi:hypothetical protein
MSQKPFQPLRDMTNFKFELQRNRILMIDRAQLTLTLPNNFRNMTLKLLAVKLQILKGLLNRKDQIKEKIFRIHLSRLHKNHRLLNKSKYQRLSRYLRLKLVIKKVANILNPQCKTMKLRGKKLQRQSSN